MKQFREETDKSKKSSEQLERAATRIKEAIDPTVRVNNEMRRLAQLVDKGKISIEESGKSLAQYVAKTAAGTEAGNRRWKEQAQAIEEARQKQSALNAEGAKIKQSLETPVETYRRKLLELGKSYRANAIDQETFIRGARRLKQELKATEPVFEEVERGGLKAFGARAIQQLGSYAAGALSIGAAISEVRSQIEATRAENEKAQTLKMTAAEAEGAFRETTFSDPKRDQMDAAVRRIARDRKLPVAQVYQAMEQAYAARGDADLAIRTVDEASQQTRSPERMVGFASGVGDIIQATRIKNEEEAAGYLALAQATSRVKGEKVPIGLGKIAATYTSPLTGGSEATAAATFSALTVAGVDPEGDRMRTAAIQLNKKSRAFFAKSGGKYGLQADQHDTLDERLALLMDPSNRKMAEDFVSNTTWESAAEGAMGKMFLSEDARGVYAKSMRENATPEQRIAAARARKEHIKGGELQRTALVEQTIGSGIEQIRLAIGSDLSNERREEIFGLTGDMEGGGRGALSRAVFFARTGSTLSEEEAIYQLRNAIAGQEHRIGGVERVREKYGAEHPDVIRHDQAERIISELEELNGKRGGKRATQPTSRPARP